MSNNSNEQRFSFFASELTQKSAQELDLNQIEAWEAYKSDVIHLFALLDQKALLNGNQLLEFYTHRLISNQVLNNFTQSVIPPGHASQCSPSNLIAPSQWFSIYKAFKIRSFRPFFLLDFKAFLSHYFKLPAERIDCNQNGSNVSVVLRAESSKIDKLQERIKLQEQWINYLFCPLDMEIKYRWERIPEPLPSGPAHWKQIIDPPLWRKFLEWFMRLFSYVMRILGVILIQLLSTIWQLLAGILKWFWRQLPRLWRQILWGVAAILVIIFLYNKYISPPTQPPLPPQKITHQAIASIGGMPPIEAIKKGLANVPYMANSKRYNPLSKEEAKSYRQIGIASWYGKKSLGLLTVSGKNFDPEKLTATHETLPIPSLVKVTNLGSPYKAVQVWEYCPVLLCKHLIFRYVLPEDMICNSLKLLTRTVL